MIHVPFAISMLFLVLASVSLLYTSFALIRVVTLRLPPAVEGEALPSITVLKPLDGMEPELEANLRSFCTQAYPRYQVVFCAKRPDDPALAVAQRIRESAPCEVAVVSGGGASLRNPKIENLEAAMPLGTGELVVIADSDMRVDPTYLRRVAQAFFDARVGAATALYGAVHARSLSARLGALFVNDQFIPSVLVATALQPLRYCFGATMAVRRHVLDEIGGLPAIGSTIADDYALGDLVARRGYRVALAGAVPLTLISEMTLRALLEREVRWARTIRAMRPLGYVGTIVAFPMTFGLLNLLLSPALVPSAVLLGACIAMKVGLHYGAHRLLRIPDRPQPWLLPLREALSLVVWGAGLFGTTARWRQGNFSVRAKGR